MINKETIIKEITYYYDNKDNHKIMSALFAKGNMFKLTITEEQKNSEFIHAYAMANLEAGNNNFGFLMISTKNDTVGNFSNFDDNTKDYVYESIQKEKFPVPNSVTEYNIEESNNPDQITWREAEERITRWNNWIDTSESKGIFRAFIIPTVDVEFGVEHNCFLAMRNDKGVLIADLLVVNYQTNKIVSRNISTTIINIEDMVRPVPPFKSSMASVETVVSSYGNFGIFNYIWPLPIKL